MEKLFELRGKLDAKTNIVLILIGFGIILLIWSLLSAGENPIIPRGILCKPGEVLKAFPLLVKENALFKNICFSLGLNILSYTEAILISIPLGFLVGLIPAVRGLFQKPVDSFRYVPLTAVTGLFIVWFGLGTNMKVHFLAFGIIIYLLPVVVQRIDEVKEVFLLTVYTLGASKWQTIKSVYIPSVISRLSDDIRVLTAISWTYIIIAESQGNEGGIGALIWRTGQRQGRIDKLFALVIIIIIIGFLQDRLFTYLDKTFFPYKYEGVVKNSTNKEPSAFKAIMAYFFTALFWVGMIVYGFLFVNEFVPLLSDVPVLTYLFGPTVWIMHFYFILVVIYQVYTRFISVKQTVTT
ncbi:MAG TPA: ABC transporter permease subunit [Saprospiraceae bacterium]|mgnify:CR=1 FL=1|jgi:ABC-type nitrate/sulfonate/bicarbonate transport system permease component|nr:ABC transporter permease subunit [Saprospiraceae bacterium]MCC6687787.1 ABC transporter permease subunit [Saprospiraceae bacterium]HMV24255.1 ABC transporter permease subunit [Saprospiraceae bacterium]HMX84755.1 ABC transporter permease subunit [Saprospiraceae bacterium]HMZ72479.1 ABC transporter permease subunit [Saprospiraceae bacterium]